MKAFKLFVTLAIMAMSLGMISCDNDDDKNKDDDIKEYSKSILGVWYSEEEGDYVYFYEDGDYHWGFFFDDHDDSLDEFQYELKGNKLTFIWGKEDKDIVTIQINGKTLKITEDNESVIYQRKANLDDKFEDMIK